MASAKVAAGRSSKNNPIETANLEIIARQYAQQRIKNKGVFQPSDFSLCFSAVSL